MPGHIDGAGGSEVGATDRGQAQPTVPILLCAHLTAAWPGSSEGVVHLQDGTSAPADLARFLAEGLNGGRGLALLPPEGPTLPEVALARGLAGLTGRLKLRPLQACGLAACTVARHCREARQLPLERLDILAAALDQRLHWVMAGPTPAPRWLVRRQLAPIGRLAAVLPGLWAVSRYPGQGLTVRVAPPALSLVEGWQGAAAGGLPPNWWGRGSPEVIWWDAPTHYLPRGWVSLARPLEAPRRQRLQRAVAELGPALLEASRAAA